MIDHLNNEVISGKLSLEDAQKIAISHLRAMKYGKDGKEYFWINDFTPVMIMHPYRPDLVGENLSEFADPNGTKLFMEFVKIVSADGEGYVPYMWQWKDDQSKIVPKLSFVKEYKPWGWIIGTGIYLVDLKAEVTLMSQRLTIASVIILILVFLIAWYQTCQALKTIRMRQRAEAELLEYKDQLEIMVENRTAELQKALDGIKKLEGIIPICIHCKEIRDDKGSWSQLEEYVYEHSTAQYSHSLCEKCHKKYYPDDTG